MSPKKLLFVLGIAALGLASAAVRSPAADFVPPAPPPALPPLPQPMSVPAPGPRTNAPYAPQAILPGGVVVTLYPADSAYLNKDKIREPEKYLMWGPGEIGAIVSIHNPSIEFHPGNAALNTGAAIILAAGGGHRTLNVGGEGADEVHFFYNLGVNTVILRNRLRSDGYEPKVDGVNDALQAIKLVRAHARDWNLDPKKIGIMGFSAGAELAAAATLQWADFDRRNDLPENPLAKVSSRPDFAGIIYPGPSPFARGGTPVIPRDAPPAFITCAGWGDWIHAVWATEYFTALLNDGVPNVEMHIYARGHHPGDKVGPDEPPSTGGLTDRGFIAYGTWPERFVDWFRDLGFLGRPGVETLAARDVAANLGRVKRSAVWSPPREGAAPTVPEWARPGSATHRQVPPPADFHRPATTFDSPIGLFEGQSDIGSAVVPGSASYDAGTGRYTINSAGYNIWYTRDEFRYLWKRMSGDVSLAAGVTYPNPDGYGDRKAVLVIRQNLDDDSKEAMTALHGAGLIHLAQRPEKGASIKEQYRIEGKGHAGGAGPGAPAERIGIEKRGDSFALFVSLNGEPMHQVGTPVNLHLDGTFYVGIGFCSHLPDKSDTAVLSDVVLENSAGMVR